MGRDDREVIVVESSGGGLKWLVLGAAVGAGLALLFAPGSGKEVRRQLGRGLRSLRDLADDTLEELKGDDGDESEEANLRAMADGATYEEPETEPAPRRRPGNRPSQVSAREELERRLAAARARRRPVPPDDEEEPVA
ncbi:MAG: YtxH domain-containing protein [Gemmatimonadales bacterium]